jgi:serine/threonine protein kinase
MEFVEGETLGHLIKRCGRLEVKLALEITNQVAAGLAAVHKKNLVHRDIKPANIMVSLEDEILVTVKIIDLGLAKASRSLLNPGFQHPGLLPERRISPAPSNALADKQTSAQTFIR